MGALWNKKHEAVAQALAEQKTPEEACQLAGYKPGSSFKDNARKLSHRPDIKARVSELLAPGIAEAERQIAVDTEYVLTKARRIVEVKVANSKVKVADQIAALNLIAKVVGAFAPDRHELAGKNGGPIETADVAENEVLRRVAHMLRQRIPALEGEG